MVKLLLRICDEVGVLGRYIKKAFSYIVKPFIIIGKFIFKFVILPIYKLYLFFKRRTQVFYLPAKSRFFSFFSKKYFIHVVVVFVSFVVVVNNISAKEIRDDNFGEKTAIYAMYNEATLGYIEEVVDSEASAQAKVFSYLDKTMVSNKQTIVIDSQESVAEDQLADSLTTVTQGGAALVKPNFTETNIAQRERSSKISYSVQDGDTLGTIAEKFGISMQTVLWANNLTTRSTIQPGDVLAILPVSGVVHIVKSGETIGKIAQRYDTDAEKIIEFNKLADASDIKIGDELIVPGGTQPAIISAPQYVSNKNVNIAPIKNLINTPPPGATDIPAGKMVWPTSWHVITQYYSLRHYGLDIDGDYNSPIYAAEAGKIIKCGWGTGYGNVIYIDHGNGVQTRYAHMSKFFVSNGQYVEKGQTLGMMGTTGWSTGTHLHFEVRINGSAMNPLSYIR
ncbi:MAG TPA: peptidoglycan DD-metalloendopeptidase family protein [Candidatus Bipolaricaulota bacterium]|nr:peptidoglycan DD-metalloendopeptidase family protein [Candidatus Bipolaricaulota bacterium]